LPRFAHPVPTRAANAAEELAGDRVTHLVYEVGR
jgi:hypothetical protein